MMNAKPILEQWRVLDTLAHDFISPITTEDQNERALELLGEIWDEVGENPHHPLASLFDLLVSHIAAFEDTAYPLPEAPPERVLGFLMSQHEMTQTRLSELSGIDQGNLSRILKGERSLTLEQIRTLSRVLKSVQRFGFSSSGVVVWMGARAGGWSFGFGSWTPRILTEPPPYFAGGYFKPFH